jgi:hypothetical protein
MNKAKINELYEQAHVVYEIPYEASVVDPTIVAIHKQKVWDRYLFAELIVKEAGALLMSPEFIGRSDLDWSMVLNEHFGVEE